MARAMATGRMSLSAIAPVDPRFGRIYLRSRMPKYRLDDVVVPKVVAFGISCHVPDYRLCWSLNRALGLDLTRRRSDILEENKGRKLHFPVFEQADEEGGLRWSLVCNTCGRSKLVPDHKAADYYLLIDQETALREERILERVRAAEFVLTAFPVSLDELKSGHKLLL